MTKNNFIIYGKPSYGKEEIAAITKVVRSYWIGTGKEVLKFEKNFTKYKKISYAAALNSCTAALHLSLLTLNPKPGDEVITTPMTFASTVNSIILAGCKPVLSDIIIDTLNIDENLIEKKITKKTIAIIIVNFNEITCNIDTILNLAKKYNLKVIEDCAHSIESKYKNKNMGTFGYTGCFSFYANKNITTGEGGMLICNKKKLINRVKTLRLHGMSRDAWRRYLPKSKTIRWSHYDILEPGHKYNMIDLNAAFGIEQLKKIDKMLEKRSRMHQRFEEELSGIPLLVPVTKGC